MKLRLLNTRRTRRRPTGLALLILCGTLPFMMGGCPEFQNDVVSAIETAVRGLMNAGLDLYFDQYRSDQAS